MDVIPVGERALLKPVKAQNQTKSGIYIPDSANEGKKEGEIIAIGCEHKDLKVNDTVLYGGYSNEEFEYKGTTYLIVDIKDILAKLN